MRPELRSRLALILLAAVFVAPMMLAWYLVKYTDVGRGGAGVSHGELIVPPRPLPDIALRNISDPGREARLHGKWTLIYLTAGSCPDACRAALRAMQAIRLATGRNTHRVQRLLLQYGDGAGTPAAAEFPGLLVADGAPDRDVFTLRAGDDPAAAGRIYISDPLGNLMMSYAPGTAPDDIIADLKRLLRYSAIG